MKSADEKLIWRIFEAGYFPVAAAAVLMICSRASFLYPFHNWDDVNSYLSMGKCMMDGSAVPYRDLFDQKGPCLYFAYGLCSLISRTEFTGVYLMELILTVSDLAGIYRILRLYLSKGWSAVLSVPVLALMFSSLSFYWGGSAEELCLPFLILPLYMTLRRLGQEEKVCRKLTPREIFLTGLCCGIVADIKYTGIGFYFGFMVLVMLQDLFAAGKDAAIPRRIGSFLKSCGIFLIGMFLPTVPWLIYFGMHGAVRDWFNVYIYNNVVVYSTFGGNDHGASLAGRVYETIKLLYWVVLSNLQYFVLVIFGLAGIFFMKVRENFLLAVSPVILWFFHFLGIYIGGVSLPYYSLPLSVFTVLGAAALGKLAGALYDRLRDRAKVRRELSGKGLCLAAAAAIAVSMGICGTRSLNRTYLGTQKEQLFVFRFAQDIQADVAAGIVEKPTLLNFGALDAGLYTAADIDPTCYWYQTQTLPIDDVEEDQKDYIRYQQVDYVLGCGRVPEITGEFYDLIDTFDQDVEGRQVTYYLYRKNTLR